MTDKAHGGEPVKRYTQMSGAMVETFNTFDGAPAGNWVEAKDYDTLRAQLAAAEERERLRLAGISTAAIGYWKEGDEIHPDYDTVTLRDVAKLYQKCAAAEKERDRAVLQANAQDEQFAARKASCVEKCNHLDWFVCDYEDGTRHCLECVAEKAWQAESRLAAAEEDARRYRYLRGLIPLSMSEGRIPFRWEEPLHGGGSLEKTVEIHRASLDTAIDAALRSAEGGKDD